MDVTNTFVNYALGIKEALETMPISKIEQAVKILRAARRHGKRVFICGNGGSASTAAHMACDLSKNAANDYQPDIKAINLADNMALITAYANDIGYENIFDYQLYPMLQAGDVVIGISTSGQSYNVFLALRYAQNAGAKTIAFTGLSGGTLAGVSDVLVNVPSTCIEQVEDLHLILEHLITTILREDR